MGGCEKSQHTRTKEKRKRKGKGVKLISKWSLVKPCKILLFETKFLQNVSASPFSFSVLRCTLTLMAFLVPLIFAEKWKLVTNIFSGTYGSFGNWSKCPVSCYTNPSFPTQQTRTRACMGATLNGVCDGPDKETRICSVNILCNGKAFRQVNHLVTLLTYLFPMHIFSITLKTSENRRVFWCFQGVEKGYTEKK